jgi:hypothetical protein
VAFGLYRQTADGRFENYPAAMLRVAEARACP